MKRFWKVLLILVTLFIVAGATIASADGGDGPPVCGEYIAYSTNVSGTGPDDFYDANVTVEFPSIKTMHVTSKNGWEITNIHAHDAGNHQDDFAPPAGTTDITQLMDVIYNIEHFSVTIAKACPAPYWEFYNDIVPGEEGARLVHPTDVRVYEVYVLECDGERTEAAFRDPWSGVAWVYEEGDVRIKEVGAFVSWFDPATQSWNEPEWIIGSQSCGAVEPNWTGRWVHTYPGNFWCNLVSFEKGPIRFKNPEYVDDTCAEHWLLGDWQGGVDYKVFKEMRLPNGDLKAGNHYYVPAGQ